MALFNPNCKMQCYLDEGKCCEFYAYCQANQPKKIDKQKAIELYLNELIENTNIMYKKINEQIDIVNKDNELIKKELIKIKGDIKNGSKNINARTNSKK